MINDSDLQKLWGGTLEEFENEIQLRASALANINSNGLKIYVLLGELFSNKQSGIIFVDSSGYEASQFWKNYLALKVAERVLGDEFNREFLKRFLDKFYQSRGLFGEPGNEYCQRHIIKRNPQTLYAFLCFVSDKTDDLFEEIISISGIRLDYLVDALTGSPDLSPILNTHNLQNQARTTMIIKSVLSSVTEAVKHEPLLSYCREKFSIEEYKTQNIEKLLMSIQQHSEDIRLSFYHALIKELNQTPALAVEINAIIKQLPHEIQKNNAIVHLERYIIERNEHKELYIRRSFLKSLGFNQTAYTTETKVKTAQALIDSIKNNTELNLDTHHNAALNDGELSKIYIQFQHLFVPSLPAAGPSSSLC